jgi:hypothetical protein
MIAYIWIAVLAAQVGFMIGYLAALKNHTPNRRNDGRNK